MQQTFSYTHWNFDGYQLKTFHGLKWHFSRKKRKYKSTMATKKSGNFRNYIKSEKDVSFKDFSNPFTFYNLMFKESHTFICWLQDRGLLRRNVICKNCRNEMMITAREGNIDGFAFRCKKGHEQSIRKYSFFQGSHYMMQDILVFVVEFLKQQPLKRCAEAAGIDYKKSSVDWANFIRDLFKQYVFEHYSTIKLARRS